MSTLKDARAAEWPWIAPETLQKGLYQQENHRGQMLTLQELRLKIEQAFDEARNSEYAGHITLIADTLTGGLYSEMFFIQLLLKAVMVDESHLSVIACNGTKEEEKMNVYEVIKDLLKHEEYRERVRFRELKTEILKQNAFTEFLDECFDPTIEMVHDPASSPLFLLFIADYMLHITFSRGQWRVETYRPPNKIKIDIIHDTLFENFGKTSEASVVKEAESFSVYMKLRQVILNIFSLSSTDPVK